MVIIKRYFCWLSGNIFIYRFWSTSQSKTESYLLPTFYQLNQASGIGLKNTVRTYRHLPTTHSVGITATVLKILLNHPPHGWLHSPADSAGFTLLKIRLAIISEDSSGWTSNQPKSCFVASEYSAVWTILWILPNLRFARSTVLISVADPDSFFTGPDPGIFLQSGSGSRPKTRFFKGNYKILGEIFVFNQKSRYRYLFY